MKARASLIAQLEKNLPAMQKTPVQFLGWEDPLEKERLLTPVFWSGYNPWGCKELDMTEQHSLSLYRGFQVPSSPVCIASLTVKIPHQGGTLLLIKSMNLD